MKVSVATTVSALAAVAAAKPAFTNSNFNIKQGQSFTLTYTGCDSGCTIILENGGANNLQPVQTLTCMLSAAHTYVRPSLYEYSGAVERLACCLY
jgi:hypothetical protein